MRAFCVAFDVLDNLTSDVAAGDFFDTKTRRSVDLEDLRTAAGAHNIDTGNREAHRLSGGHCDLLFLSG